MPTLRGRGGALGAAAGDKGGLTRRQAWPAKPVFKSEDNDQRGWHYILSEE